MELFESSTNKKSDFRPPNLPETYENDEFPPPSHPHDKDHMQIMGGESQYNEQFIENLQDIFSLYDQDHTGVIKIAEFETILTSIKHDKDAAKAIL